MARLADTVSTPYVALVGPDGVSDAQQHESSCPKGTLIPQCALGAFAVNAAWVCFPLAESQNNVAWLTYAAWCTLYYLFAFASLEYCLWVTLRPATWSYRSTAASTLAFLLAVVTLWVALGLRGNLRLVPAVLVMVVPSLHYWVLLLRMRHLPQSSLTPPLQAYRSFSWCGGGVRTLPTAFAAASAVQVALSLVQWGWLELLSSSFEAADSHDHMQYGTLVVAFYSLRLLFAQLWTAYARALDHRDEAFHGQLEVTDLTPI